MWILCWHAFGSYFFEDENEHWVTMTSQQNVTMLLDFVISRIQQNMEIYTILFQLDGTIADTAYSIVELLRASFPGKLISLKRHI